MNFALVAAVKQGKMKEKISYRPAQSATSEMGEMMYNPHAKPKEAVKGLEIKILQIET